MNLVSNKQREQSSQVQRWYESRLLALCEFIIVFGIFVADLYHLILLSKTPFLLLLGWVSLRVRRLKWKDVGLRSPVNWTLGRD